MNNYTLRFSEKSKEDIRVHGQVSQLEQQPFIGTSLNGVVFFEYNI